jgi:hypothetical protein
MTSSFLQDIKSYLASGLAISVRQESKKEMTLVGLRTSIIELCRWLKAQWIAEVPDELALCEFECRKSECSFDGWANCVRRISQTPKGPGPLRHSADGLLHSLERGEFNPRSIQPLRGRRHFTYPTALERSAPGAVTVDVQAPRRRFRH